MLLAAELPSLIRGPLRACLVADCLFFFSSFSFVVLSLIGSHTRVHVHPRCVAVCVSVCVWPATLP